MAYPPELRRWIKKFEETRPRRLRGKARGEDFPSLTLGERGEIKGISSRLHFGMRPETVWRT